MLWESRMKPFVSLDQKRSAACAAASCFRTTNPRVFGSLYGDDHNGSNLGVLVIQDVESRSTLVVQSFLLA